MPPEVIHCRFLLFYKKKAGIVVPALKM